MRHTFAVTCLINGISLEVIRQLLGHEYLTTTQTYTLLDLNQKREILNKYFTKTNLREMVDDGPLAEIVARFWCNKSL
ncbi:Tyrosine recombinase XerC [Moorella thermoacetica]